ncbi:serine/threonine protein kinase [Flindersiella endophytica]
MDQLRANDPRQLGGYTLVGRLGEGGQGTVYAARTPAGVPVAIKLLRADLADDPAARARFVKELAASARVGPACTARVLEADVEGARPYVVSEYVDGPSLQALVAQRGPLAGAELARLAAGMLIALEAVHAAGIVHRDFKPANVLVDANGPRVIDFGIARALDATATLTSKVIGTPAYMAPEQFTADSAPAGPAADVFAWAATVAFAATGRAPFGSDSVPQVMHRILYSGPDLTGIPNTPLLRVLTRCLQKDPRQRPTVREARAELAAGGTSDAVPDDVTAPVWPPAGVPGDGPRRPRRRALVAVSSALSVVLVGVLVWAGVHYLDRERDLNAGNDPTGSRSSSAVPAAAADKWPRAGLRLEDTGATVASDLDEEVTLTSFNASRSFGPQPYLWNPKSGVFEAVANAKPYQTVRASPDGRWAVGTFSFRAGKDSNYVTLIDRNNPAPEDRQIIRPPDGSMRLHEAFWSPNGKHLLILVLDNTFKTGQVPSIKGLLLVTPGKRLDGTLLDLADRSTFAWQPDSVGFAVNVDPPNPGDLPDILFYNLQGKQQDEGGKFPKAGWLGSMGYGSFSPSGKKLVTSCGKPGEPAMACVYDMERTVPITAFLDTTQTDPSLVPIGFYDENHLLTVQEIGKDASQGSKVVVLDLDGNPVKTLVNNPRNVTLEFSVRP